MIKKCFMLICVLGFYLTGHTQGCQLILDSLEVALFPEKTRDTLWFTFHVRPKAMEFYGDVNRINVTECRRIIKNLKLCKLSPEDIKELEDTRNKLEKSLLDEFGDIYIGFKQQKELVELIEIIESILMEYNVKMLYPKWEDRWAYYQFQLYQFHAKLDLLDSDSLDYRKYKVVGYPQFLKARYLTTRLSLAMFIDNPLPIKDLVINSLDTLWRQNKYDVTLSNAIFKNIFELLEFYDYGDVRGMLLKNINNLNFTYFRVLSYIGRYGYREDVLYMMNLLFDDEFYGELDSDWIGALDRQKELADDVYRHLIKKAKSEEDNVRSRAIQLMQYFPDKKIKKFLLRYRKQLSKQCTSEGCDQLTLNSASGRCKQLEAEKKLLDESLAQINKRLVD